MPDKCAEWRQTQTSRALLLHALPLDDGVIGVPLCFCVCLLLSVLQNPFLKVKGCKGCPVSTSLQRLLQRRVIIRLDLKGISRYSSSVLPPFRVAQSAMMLRCVVAAGRTGVQDGRVPSKSAQMSMPQNPMKFELEVPGML